MSSIPGLARQSFESQLCASCQRYLLIYNIGRVGAAIAPWLIGVMATRYSIGLGLIVMGGAYFLTGMIPAVFIREKMYDPQRARASAAVAETT